MYNHDRENAEIDERTIFLLPQQRLSLKAVKFNVKKFLFFNFRSQLPARATRLLNRRLQNNSTTSPLNGSESPRSLDSMHSRTSSASARASLREHLKQRQQLNLQSQLMNSSSEDLLADKSFRNSMLQDVVTFKKQLVQLRRVLQEVSACFCVGLCSSMLILRSRYLKSAA